MALKTQPRKQHSQTVRSLHELGSLTSPPTPVSADHVPTADVKDVELKALDANSAHVVVTLCADTPAAPAAETTKIEVEVLAPASAPDFYEQAVRDSFKLTSKEINMTATTIDPAAAAAPVTSAAPAAAPAAPVAAPTAAAQRFGFAPDFSFLQNPEILNKTIHDLSGGLNTVNDRVDSLEARMSRIQAGAGGISGRIVASEDNSMEAIAYKVGTAALVGAAAYTGVKLASWLLDSPAPAGQ